MPINCYAIEFLRQEMNEKSKSIIPNLTYKLPNGEEKEFEKQLNKILSTSDILKKEVIMAGGFNTNVLYFEHNKKA